MIGRTLSHYEVRDEISRGGMGIVYRAVDTKLNREVALKVLPPELVADAERKRRFLQEAQAAAALEDPHIAVIHEIDEAEGVTFIAMELILGEKLRDAIERGRLSVARTLDLATEVAEGLARAHAKGIVHRDLKPANVMLTEAGHAKIIDFGLAKLVAPLAGLEDLETETAARDATDAGKVLGTVAYMSPEQARGARVDHRTDIFSFGIVLYEMLTGQQPFRGQSALDVLNAIVREPAPALPPLDAGAAAADLTRIIEKCLAKDPDERYQGMRDLVVDLRAARRHLESGSGARPALATSSTTEAARVSTAAGIAAATWAPRLSLRSRWLWVGGALLAIAAGATAVRLARTRPGSSLRGEKPSLAVLYFENNTGDASLDWLRTGLTDMLVTDLSQSPGVRVLSTDRLYQVLKELGRLDERVVSFETVTALSERANVQNVLLGSFVRAGSTIRISVKLQEAKSGEILAAERVEASGEANLFPSVDDLTRRLKARFETSDASKAATLEADRDLKDITTSSPEAYRYYVEGIKLHEQGKEREAIPLLEKAVAVDPSFAMAFAKLAIVHGNLFLLKEADEYGQRALEHADRLTPRERYYIEGVHYSQKRQTWMRSFEAYEKAVELFPDHASARNNLALGYLQLEIWDKAIEHYEELRRQEMTFPGTFGGLASAYAARGDFEKGEQVLRRYLQANPSNAEAQNNLARYLFIGGKLDEALAAFDKMEALAPGEPWTQLGRFELLVLRQEWDRAGVSAQAAADSSDPFARLLGSIFLAELRLYQGRTREARAITQEAARAFSGAGPLGAFAHGYHAYVLYERGELAPALEAAVKARDEGRGDEGECYALSLVALSQAKLGRHDAAMKTVEQCRKLLELVPGTPATRAAHHLAGELALIEDRAAIAVDELKQAAALLSSPRGRGGAPTSHVPIWFALASAHLATGDDAQAAEWFGRVASSSAEHVAYPIPYVRSFYFLGKLHDKRGDKDEAQQNYRRFVVFWQDGDLDRERVAEAERALR